MSTFDSEDDEILPSNHRRPSRTSLRSNTSPPSSKRRSEIVPAGELKSIVRKNNSKIKREEALVVGNGVLSEGDEEGDEDVVLGRRKRKVEKEKVGGRKRIKREVKVEEKVVVKGNGVVMNGERHRWWDSDSERKDKKKKEGNGIKWKSLQHNGVWFPPEYEPHGIPILYNGNKIELEPKAEEIATFYAAKLDTEHVKKRTFNKNFFKDFRESMRGSQAYKIVRKLDYCDFRDIKKLLDKRNEEKKRKPAAEKKRLRLEEQEKLKHYTTAVVDGRIEKLANFKIEPPGLFMGRGEHPLAGKVKRRIYPEDVTINVGKNDPVPECPVPGHKWGEIVHNNLVTWLAGWKDTITNGSKYVWLSADSMWKGQSDREKFEKARELKKYIGKIRKDYRAAWKAKGTKEIRQRSIVMYLIDKLALRVGNEKGEDEADTVGCCSLRVEHLKFKPENTVEFDFLGKDSIRYQNSVKVEQEVYLNLKRFCRDKGKEEKVFDKLTTSDLNAYLKELMPGLTAKVFRTYNASIVLDELLQKTPPDLDLNNLLVFYNRANREVAELCNHQKSVSSTHATSMEKLEKKVREAKEWKETLLRAKAKLIKDKKRDQIEVIQLVHAKPEYKEGMDDVQKAEERKRAEAAPRIKKKRTMKLESVKKNIQMVKVKIEKLDAQMTTKEDLKTVSLGTSKMNYLDPRITVAWCKKHDVPIEKVFAKTLMTKFAWAMEDSEDYRF